MFKSKEGLKEGKRGLICIGIDKAFKSIAERRDFYKKYKGSPEYFANDFPGNEWWKQNETKYRTLNITSVPSRDFYEGHYKLRLLIEEFNDWLFDFCFDGIKE
ncbi:MAG: hypothetical protein IMZ58_07750 [Thermoplasmata archaeon]|nr:hypothetical protein [Thermoplasmata archaeon]